MAKPAGGAATADKKADAAPKPSDDTAARRSAAAAAEGELEEGGDDEEDDGDTSHIRIIGGDGTEGDERPGAEKKAEKSGDKKGETPDPAAAPSPAEEAAAAAKAAETAAAAAKSAAAPKPDAKTVPLSALTKEREQNRALHARLLQAQRQVAELMGGMDADKLAGLGLAVAGQPKDKADLYRDEMIGNRMGDEFARHPLATSNPRFTEDMESIMNAHPELEASTKVVGGIPVETAARAYWALYVLDRFESLPDAPPPAAVAAPAAGSIAPPAAPAAAVPAATAIPAPDRIEKAALTPTGGGAADREPSEAEIDSMTDEEWEAHRKKLGLDAED